MTKSEITYIIFSRCKNVWYWRRVKEIPADKERTVIADWFVPLDGYKGIYIEYWGMESKRYLENKKEKKELYKKYNLPLIEIEKEDKLELNENLVEEKNVFQKFFEEITKILD